MRILYVHNYYKEPGGEDVVFSSTASLMRARGHQVTEYVTCNSRIDTMSKLAVAIGTVWSHSSYQTLLTRLRQERPDVVHFFNIFPLISPSAYYACQRANVPVVQSLDNPRLICPAAKFHRNGKLCLDCLGRTPPWPGILHGCYHGSRFHTAVVSTMLTAHRMAGTWKRLVDQYLVATGFYRDLFIQGGLPADRVTVKPHFLLRDPGLAPGAENGRYVLFLGRLDPEKGIRTLLKAWEGLSIPLKIRGSGKLETETRAWIAAHSSCAVEIVERLDEEGLLALIRGARFLIWPSEGYYETFGLAAVECFAAGIPVIASRIGVMTEIVRDGETGLHFHPGDPQDLADKVNRLWQQPELSARMGRRARLEYEQKYTAAPNYERLISIYHQVITARKGD